VIGLAETTLHHHCNVIVVSKL